MPDMVFWTGFLFAVFLINISPGPEMIFVVAKTLSAGRRRGFFAALGAAVGSSVHVLMVAFGLAVILATSLLAFTVIKVLGAVYLIYLGIRAILSRTSALNFGSASASLDSSVGSLRKGFFVGLLNPKSVIFFLAFLPQFVKPEHGAYAFQILGLGMFTVLAGVGVELIVIVLVDRISDGIKRQQFLMSWIERALGVVLVGLGLKLILSSGKD